MDLSQRVDGTVDEAHGLPRAAYVSDDFVSLERERLFGRHWHAIGFAHDVPGAGDVHPVMSPAGRSLLLVRDSEHSVRVFHNYCRHRGMQLVEETRRGCTKIVCPYHAWCYDLDGRLTRIPHREGYGKHADDPGDVPGLQPVRSDVWSGIVFADLSGEAPDFRDYVAPLARRWSHYDLSLLRYGVGMDFDVPGNWKLAIENFIDIYHVPYVHPGLNQYNNMTDHYFIREGDIVLGEGNDEYQPTDEAAGKLPEFPDLNARQRSTIEAICVFPNLLLTVFSDNLRAIIVEPTGPASCHERVAIFFVGEAAMAQDKAQCREIVAGRFPSFNREDVEVVTRLQRAFETSAFERAHFNAFFDGSVHGFQQLVGRACSQG